MNHMWRMASLSSSSPTYRRASEFANWVYDRNQRLVLQLAHQYQPAKTAALESLLKDYD
jgi:hypothetical protein